MDKKHQLSLKLLKNIKPTTNLNDLINGDVVIESVTEDANVKKQLFKELDGILRDKTVIATNASSLSIDKLASVTSRADRFIGMYFLIRYLNCIWSRSFAKKKHLMRQLMK